MRDLQAQVVASFKRSDPDHRLASRPTRFFEEEFAWIAGHGIEDEAEYIEVERVGRSSARFLRVDREKVFDLYRAYLAARSDAGYDYDLQDMPHYLHLALRAGQVKVPYRHIVIDEAQDFAPEVLRAASMMVPPNGSLTVFADYAQQIYGRRMSWRSAGLAVSKLWELNGNYRNTHEIAAVAAAIAANPEFGTDDLLPVPPAYQSGPKPVLAQCSTSGSEDELIVREATRFGRHGSVAVLVRTTRDRRRLAGILPSSAMRLDRDIPAIRDEGIYYGTLHAAKGLEFDSVIIANCSSDHLPDPASTEALGEEQARVDDLRLLYVGVTRARKNLMLSHSGNVSELVPRDAGLFDIRAVG